MNIRQLGFMPGLPAPARSDTGRMGLGYLGTAGNMISNLPNPGAGDSTTINKSVGGNWGDVIGESLGIAGGALGAMADAGVFSGGGGGGNFYQGSIGASGSSGGGLFGR
ncbi:hypothetical protein [Oceanidesulfovibrio marinus]|uniref:Uncharacterized protein n=1 Tax=Oceanidesulfovibrio marinus TaxID=370038 RepID=A0A6P1ZDS8_9BACT|nr:hypothetical protein [Oceanidesulfovibrio marinus]TVM30258.1 hypothetical protein DQK91_21385 [Oceanidesulfovibrio marinus]